LNSIDIKIWQYADDWSFIGEVVSVAENDTAYQLYRYTAGEGVAHVLVDKSQGFFAESSDVAIAAINHLYPKPGTSTGNIAANLKVKYLPVGINEAVSHSVVDFLLTGQSDLLRKIIHNSRGLKWNCLGDSLTTLGWGANMYSMVSEKLGLTPRDYGIVSSTIANYNNDGTTGNPMCVRYANMDDDADIVTVMGGTNDWATDEKVGTIADRDSTTLYGGCHVLFRGLIEKYPNAKIGVILPPQNGQGIPWYVETQGGDPDMAKMRKKVNVIREVAEYYSLPVLDLFNHGGIPGMLPSTINRLLQGDYLHITTEGYKVLSRPLLAFIEYLIG
jgi:lysophospholipase L1-like esterase